MRLIDADALIAQLKCDTKDCDKCPAHDYWFGCGKVKEFIDNAPTIDAVPRWIPCEERLPEKYDQYLCCTREGVFHTPCLDDSELSIRWAEDEDIVAWMPLPEPYKGERRDDE